MTTKKSFRPLNPKQVGCKGRKLELRGTTLIRCFIAKATSSSTLKLLMDDTEVRGTLYMSADAVKFK